MCLDFYFRNKADHIPLSLALYDTVGYSMIIDVASLGRSRGISLCRLLDGRLIIGRFNGARVETALTEKIPDV